MLGRVLEQMTPASLFLGTHSSQRQPLGPRHLSRGRGQQGTRTCPATLLRAAGGLQEAFQSDFRTNSQLLVARSGHLRQVLINYLRSNGTSVLPEQDRDTGCYPHSLGCAGSKEF